ncbi:MAG: plasmid pRiA4b ORF-3 family protein [Bacteroidales bacterium]|nr:plasmid pRiA4b ORF-3 family protein [Bacteroidales bacterium]
MRSWKTFIKFEYFLKKIVKYPICIAGELACPPEDCGGIPGYYELLEILSNPDAEEYEDIKTWIGEEWNPQKFKMQDIKFMNPYKRWENAFLRD